MLLDLVVRPRSDRNGALNCSMKERKMERLDEYEQKASLSLFRSSLETVSKNWQKNKVDRVKVRERDERNVVPGVNMAQ
jgi:hypothetical protein